METVDFLRRHVPLFAGVSDAELSYLADSASGKRYAAGQNILLRGTTVDGLHIVAVGKAVVHAKISGRGAPFMVAELGTGEVFGETSIVELGMAGAKRAGGPEGAAVIVIPQEAFRGLLVRDESFAVRVNTLIRARKPSPLGGPRRGMKKILAASAALAALTVAVLAYGLGAPEATLLGPAVTAAAPRDGGRPQVALTFDDGPSPYTARVLDVLRAQHVHATFFLCGENAARYPELVRRIRAEGHEIGNHTWSHPYLYLMSRERIADEIDRTQDILEKLSGRRPTLFRPPYGVRWFSLWPLLRERGLTLVMWNDRGYDGDGGSPDIAARVLKGLKPGAIVLLHDGFETHAPSEVDRAATLGALPAIIAGARKAGYAFAAVPRS